MATAATVSPSSIATERTLNELLNLALGTPEVGAVNFNLLHTLLAAILQRLDLQNVITEVSADQINEAEQVEDPGGFLPDSPSAPSENAKSSPVTTVTEPSQSLLSNEAAPSASHMKSVANLNKKVSALESRLQTLAPPSSVQQKDRAEVGALKEKVAKLQNKLDALDALPSNEAIIKKSKSGTSARPAADVWQHIQLQKKVETNEGGVSKALSLIDDLMTEMNQMKEKQDEADVGLDHVLKTFGPDSGLDHTKMKDQLKGASETKKKMHNLEKDVKKLETKLDDVPQKIDLEPFVTWPLLEEVLTQRVPTGKKEGHGEISVEVPDEEKKKKRRSSSKTQESKEADRKGSKSKDNKRKKEEEIDDEELEDQEESEKADKKAKKKSKSKKTPEEDVSDEEEEVEDAISSKKKNKESAKKDKRSKEVEEDEDDDTEEIKVPKKKNKESAKKDKRSKEVEEDEDDDTEEIKVPKKKNKESAKKDKRSKEVEEDEDDDTEEIKVPKKKNKESVKKEKRSKEVEEDEDDDTEEIKVPKKKNKESAKKDKRSKEVEEEENEEDVIEDETKVKQRKKSSKQKDKKQKELEDEEVESEEEEEIKLKEAKVGKPKSKERKPKKVNVEVEEEEESEEESEPIKKKAKKKAKEHTEEKNVENEDTDSYSLTASVSQKARERGPSAQLVHAKSRFPAATDILEKVAFLAQKSAELEDRLLNLEGPPNSLSADIPISGSAQDRERSRSHNQLYHQHHDHNDVAEKLAHLVETVDHLQKEKVRLHDLMRMQQESIDGILSMKSQPIDDSSGYESAGGIVPQDIKKLEMSCKRLGQKLATNIKHVEEIDDAMAKLTEEIHHTHEENCEELHNLRSDVNEVKEVQKMLERGEKKISVAPTSDSYLPSEEGGSASDAAEESEGFVFKKTPRQHQMRRGTDNTTNLQNAILDIKGELEKINSLNESSMEEHESKQKHIDFLYEFLEKLEDVKADKDVMKVELDQKGDKRALALKVSRADFDVTIGETRRNFEEFGEKMDGQEEAWKMLVKRVNEELESKVDRLEMQSLRQNLENKIKALRRMIDHLPMKDGMPEGDDAAAFKKQLIPDYSCLSCDRQLELAPQIPGPSIPANPSLPVSRSVRPYTSYGLENIRQHARGMSPGKNAINFKNALEEREMARMRKMEDMALKTQVPPEEPHVHREPSPQEPDVLPPSGRPCGGNYTLTYPQRRYTRLTHLSELWQEEEALADVARDEVELQGHDGHIYRGRLPTIPMIVHKNRADPSNPNAFPRPSSAVEQSSTPQVSCRPYTSAGERDFIQRSISDRSLGRMPGIIQ